MNERNKLDELIAQLCNEKEFTTTKLEKYSIDMLSYLYVLEDGTFLSREKIQLAHAILNLFSKMMDRRDNEPKKRTNSKTILNEGK